MWPRQGRTVLFVSHNMSAILRLTQETLVIEKGHLKMRAPTPEAVDYYLSQGFSQEGQRIWDADEIPADAAPFRPIAVRILGPNGSITNTVRSSEAFMVEIEY